MRSILAVKCPITKNGYCRFAADTTSDLIPKPLVFYAFDTAAGQGDKRKFLADAIRSRIELAVKSCGADFYAFDRDKLGASTDWLCEKVCLPIQNSALLVADISCYDDGSRYTSNPNVTFEAGIALGFRKNVMFVLHKPPKGKNVIADFGPFEYFSYPEDFNNNRFQENLTSFFAAGTFSRGFELISSKSYKTKLLHKVERMPGDWLVSSDYHSFLFRPLDHLRALAASNATDDLDGAARQSIIEDRWHHFREQLKANVHSFLHLYETAGIEEYFRTGIGRRSTPIPTPVSAADRLAEIDETVRLLRTYHPRLQVAFYERPLPYAMLVRPDNCAFIDSKSDLTNTLNGLFVTYRNIVEDITDAFYDCWNSIPAEHKSLSHVLGIYDQLKEMVQHSEGEGK